MHSDTGITSDEHVLNESDARIWRAFREPLPAVTDLSSPIETGAVMDREGKPIAPHVLPQVRNEDELVTGGLNDAIDASMVADWLHRGNEGKPLPEGWKQIDHPELKREMEKTGAYHLVSPSGMQYVAFGSNAQKKSPLETMKQAFGLSSKAESAARIGNALRDNYDVTYTGRGRGGALAKIGSEAASTFLANAGDNVRPKTCVAIDSTSVPPATYKALGLAEKSHARTTVAISRTTDLRGRFKNMFARSDQVQVKERSNDRRVVGGPRDGEKRDPESSKRFDVSEHLAHTDLKIKLKGAIKLSELREYDMDGERRMRSKPAAAAKLQGYVREDILRKHLLAASRGDVHAKGREILGQGR